MVYSSYNNNYAYLIERVYCIYLEIKSQNIEGSLIPDIPFESV